MNLNPLSYENEEPEVDLSNFNEEEWVVLFKVAELRYPVPSIKRVSAFAEALYQHGSLTLNLDVNKDSPTNIKIKTNARYYPKGLPVDIDQIAELVECKQWLDAFGGVFSQKIDSKEYVWLMECPGNLFSMVVNFIPTMDTDAYEWEIEKPKPVEVFDNYGLLTARKRMEIHYRPWKVCTILLYNLWTSAQKNDEENADATVGVVKLGSLKSLLFLRQALLRTARQYPTEFKITKDKKAALDESKVLANEKILIDAFEPSSKDALLPEELFPKTIPLVNNRQVSIRDYLSYDPILLGEFDDLVRECHFEDYFGVPRKPPTNLDV